MGQTAYRAAVLADSPAVFFETLDNGGLLRDTSGNNLNMTSVSGTPVYRRTGPFDGAYGVKMDGATFTRSQVTGNTDFVSFEFWLKQPTLKGANASLVGNCLASSNGYELITPSAGHYAFVLHAIGVLGANTALMAADTWYYIVGRRNTQWRYSINATADGAPATTNPNAPSGGTFNINRAGDGTFEISNLAFYLFELTLPFQATHYAAALEPEGGYPVTMPPHLLGWGG